MNGPLLQPGDLPKFLTRAERRRLADGEAEDARTQRGIRPNDTSHLRQDFDRCTQSKYFTHRFDANLWTTCSFCGRHYKDCVVNKS